MIIAIIGPTAVGKTKLSIELAKKYDGEIINADSTAIYKELDIATAKPTKDEQQQAKHHLIDILSPLDDYTVYDYQIDARKALDDILSRNKTAIIVGGSGLYISALLYDYKFSKESNVYDFDALTDLEMYNQLKKLHPDLEIDKHNRQRLIRAYAKYINNSEPFSEENGGNNLVYEVSIVGLTTDRDILYNRISKRVDNMIEDGLLKEVRYVLNKYPDSKEVNTIIGYKEFIPYINEKEGLEEALIRLKQNSRNYAKRQYTWFNHKMNPTWFNVDFNDFSNTIKEVEDYLEK